jgi:hypothetical protein
VFDDKTSFTIEIATAKAGLSMADLGHLMNEFVFGYPGSPLRDLSFETAGARLKQSGILHKGVDIPFVMMAAVEATPAGLIRIRPVDLRICGINGAGLLRALGLTLTDLLDVSKAKGVSVRGNDLFLDPNVILPPPAIRGRLAQTRVGNGEIVLIFSDSALAAALGPISPPDSTTNFMYFAGGTLRFGKLFMVQADLEIADADPKDPFDFSIDDYQRQLVAGDAKTLPDLGLKVLMPDLADMTSAAAQRR